MNGKILSSYQEQIPVGQHQLKLKDADQLNAGVYFVTIINHDGMAHSFKLIKQ